MSWKSNIPLIGGNDDDEYEAEEEYVEDPKNEQEEFEKYKKHSGGTSSQEYEESYVEDDRNNAREESTEKVANQKESREQKTEDVKERKQEEKEIKEEIENDNLERTNDLGKSDSERVEQSNFDKCNNCGTPKKENSVGSIYCPKCEPERGKEREKKEQELENLPLPDLGEFHRDVLSPQGVEDFRTYTKVDNDYVRTYFINEWPDTASNLFLTKALYHTPVRNDISIHIKPYSQEEAVSDLERVVQRTKSKTMNSGSSITQQSETNRKFEQAQRIYNIVKETPTGLFDVSMYVSVRGETREEVDNNTKEILRNLRRSPALTVPTQLSNMQKEGMQSVSPICEDVVNYKREMLGGAIGAMLPFSSKTIVEENGVDFGMHAGNNSPVMIERFERNNGYNQFTVGKIGSGKSFSTKLNLLRTYANRDDVIVYMLDPVGGFNKITNALDGEKIMVGGKLGINPLDIKETPKDVLEKLDKGSDPYSQKVRNVMEFFEKYFDQRNEKLSGNKRGLLERAIKNTYENAGITQEIETHSNESPTLSDLLRTIEDMADNPKKYTRTDSEDAVKNTEKIANNLSRSMEQFREGQEYSNLAGESDIDLDQDEVIYFDLSQQEGGSEFGIMMHLILTEVYKKAKTTDKKTIFAIDEAHYLLQDPDTIDFLETAVRHSRHINLGINFITQEVEDFFQNEKTKAIVRQCSIKLMHRTETGLTEEMLDTLEMNEEQHQFVRKAEPGDPELGYSEALIGVGNYGYVPMRVFSSPTERKLID
jgi:hypothetical protein